MSQRWQKREKVVGHELGEATWFGGGERLTMENLGGHWTSGYLNATVYLCSTVYL